MFTKSPEYNAKLAAEGMSNLDEIDLKEDTVEEEKQR